MITSRIKFDVKTLIEINELLMNSKSRLMQIISSLKQRPASETLDIHLKKTNESF